MPIMVKHSEFLDLLERANRLANRQAAKWSDTMGLSAEVKTIISETQSLVSDGFKGDKSVPAQQNFHSIKKLASVPDEQIKAILGKSGMYLKRFCVRVNVEHPDLNHFLGGYGSNAASIFADAIQILEKAIPNNETWFLSLHDSYPQLVRALQHPPSRLLASMEDRKEQRQEKNEILMVGLKQAFSTGENSFFARPSDFKRFARNSTAYQTELRRLADRCELFRNKSMGEMSNAYAQQMRDLEESISPISGFHRLTPAEAAIIAARLHGYKWSGANAIYVSSKSFDNCRFWGGSEETETQESLKKTLILNTRFSPNADILTFNYQPRYYPLHCFTMPLPEKTQKIINQAEHFAPLNDCPFFDSYWLLVPSININHPSIQRNSENWTLVENGSPVTYSDPRAAALALDMMLVKSGCIMPVVLGDRDCKCFFLSMFL